MRHYPLPLVLIASAAMAVAQTAPKPATTAHAATTTHAATAAHPAAHTAATPALPANIPPVKGVVKTLIALRYQDIVVGSGPLAEANKVYRVAYTGWLAADGRKFDASADHPAQPVFDHNLQMMKDADGKPKMEAGQPFLFPQGFSKAIPGFDQGFEGMRVGGKRRLFIPWQLAYGSAGHPTGDAKNPGIPAKADLIFDLELVDMMEMPKPPTPPSPSAGRPGMGVAPPQIGVRPQAAVPPPAAAAKPVPTAPVPATPAAPAAPAAATPAPQPK